MGGQANRQLRQENARLLAELHAAQERAQAMAEILAVISRSPNDIRPVFAAIVRAAFHLMGTDGAALLLVQGDSYVMVEASTERGETASASPNPQPIDPAQNFPSRCILGKSTLLIPDWSAIELPPHQEFIARVYGLQSTLYLPLMRGEVCTGVLMLTSNRRHGLGPQHIPLAESRATACRWCCSARWARARTTRPSRPRWRSRSSRASCSIR
jgi:hypothetical protein